MRRAPGRCDWCWTARRTTPPAAGGRADRGEDRLHGADAGRGAEEGRGGQRSAGGRSDRCRGTKQDAGAGDRRAAARANEILRRRRRIGVFCSGGALPPAQAMVAFKDEHRAAYGGEPISTGPIAPSTYHAHVAKRAEPLKRSARVRRDAAEPMDRSVQQPPPVRIHRQHPAHRSRGDLLCLAHTIGYGGVT